MRAHYSHGEFDWTVAGPLAALGLTYAWTALNFAGTAVAEFNWSLLAVGVIATAAWALLFRAGEAPRPAGWFRYALMTLPAYALFQVIPLPLGLVRLISPNRAAVHDLVSQAVGPSDYTAVSLLPSATFVHVLLIAFYISVFLLVRESTWRARESPWIAAAPLLVVAFGEAALGWMHYISVAGASPASGTFVNRNHFAGMLEMSLPFAVMYAAAAVAGDRRRDFLTTPVALRASLGLGLATVILMGIVFSFSRSGFAAALAGLLAMAALGGGRSLTPATRRAAVVIVGTAVVAAFFLLSPDALIQRFADASSLEELRSQDRLQLWSETWNLVKAYPLVGCGLGAYRVAFLEFKVTMPMALDDHPHNDYLQCLAETGIVGSLIVALVVIGFVRSALSAATRHQSPQGRCLAIACFGAMFSIALHSITDFNLYLPANAMLLAWVAGIASGLDASNQFRRVGEPKR